jgi:cobalt-zinc-cadmium efflux system outer membrane protein
VGACVALDDACAASARRPPDDRTSMRHHHRGRAIALAFLVATLTASAAAQAPSAIRQGFDAAWAQLPEQRAGQPRRDAADAAIRAATRWTPEPPALELMGRTDRVTRNEGLREHEVAVAVPLWLPDERRRSREVAASERAALDMRLLALQWRLAGDVREAHWAHRRALLERELAERRLASARSLATDVARRVAAGDLARADAHQADAAVATAEAAVAASSAELVQSRQAWDALTGGASAEGPGETVPAGTPPPEHPALRDLAARTEAARRRQSLAAVQTRGNPELTVGAGRERDVVGERYRRSVIVGVRIPLGPSSASQTRYLTANAEATEAEAELQLETSRVTSRVVAARARLESLEQARTAAERRAVLGSESRGFVDKAFRLGESDLPTRLRIEFEAVEAERQAARARLEVDAAVSQLRQALGLLPE